MAYVFQTALVKAKGPNQQWVEEDISETPIVDILQTYREVMVTLSSNFLPGSVTFDMAANRNLIENFSWTVEQWLVANGNTTLPTIEGSYQVEFTKANYKDIYQAGYNLKRVHPISHPDVYYPNSELRDIFVTKEGADYEFLQKHSLVNVNGFFHYTDASTLGMYIRHGARSADVSGSTNVGLLSLANIGEVSYIPITEDMLYKQDESHDLAKKVFIDVGVEIENKTVLLCLGGYLHVLDGLYRDIGNNQIVVHLHKIDFARRYIESREHIDLSSIKALFGEVDDSVIPVDTLKSEEVAKAFLTLPQSFFVIIDTPEIITKQHDMDMTGLPGIAISHYRPLDLAFARSGRGLSYRTEEQNGQWVVHYKNIFEHSYRFETSDWLDQPNIDDAEDLAGLGQLAKVHLLEIGKETLVL